MAEIETPKANFYASCSIYKKHINAPRSLAIVIDFSGSLKTGGRIIPSGKWIVCQWMI